MVGIPTPRRTTPLPLLTTGKSGRRLGQSADQPVMTEGSSTPARAFAFLASGDDPAPLGHRGFSVDLRRLLIRLFGQKIHLQSMTYQ